ncbi:MAG: type I restriction endonuclease subunit R [Planctomycetia bacterium]|nr:MAG: type I restriction endonuclease subunit R [Planctomycetia bacterium]
MREPPLMLEDHISQIPALQLLQNLGWQYLTPAEALRLRGGRVAGVILEGILEGQLRRMNRIRFKGEEHPFSEGNIHSAVQALKDVLYDGLVRTSEKVYDLLCLGKALQQSIDGDLKSFTLQYIDWEHPERNVFHVTEEFAVERAGSRETYRPDIVLFVNGIPISVIECKKANLGPGKDPIKEAISQHLRNQKDDGIPRLFTYSQLLLAVSHNDAKYGTIGTPAKFWAFWKERGDYEETIRALINRPLSSAQKEQLFGDRFAYVRQYFDAMEADGGRQATTQDRAIWALCRPQRLLELGHRFILYDAGEKKIARYQQYFCVRKIMDRIRKLEDGKRPGGVVWHTQGSGKSLTMVMLAKAIAFESQAEGAHLHDYRIVLVTDRVDLDDQLYKTFRHCGVELEQANTGAHLVDMLRAGKHRVVATIIDKFEAAVGKQNLRIDDASIFVLVDEGHRTQYGPRHAKMRRVMPNACYIGFTGTPVMKSDRNTVTKFGGLIDTYTITDAVEDQAVVPLKYEGRHVSQTVDEEQIDHWFEIITRNLTKEQRTDLKKRFTTTDQLNKAEQKVKRIAFDVSMHFRDNFQGRTPFKGQLVTQDKATALLYKKYLNEFGMVTSEVLISGPDDREGETDVYEENSEPVIRFWKAMMEKYGTEKEYNRQLIGAFKHGDAPEIIIVVDKLLTGFDAPRNTVLYLTRNLKDHTLLQAIARVNRLHDGKDLGYILDYRGVLENLDKALDLYGHLPDFDKDDLEGILTDVREIIATLPQTHSVLWDCFRDVCNSRDAEAYERLLADDALRVRFYERFTDFARTLAVAMSTVAFIEETPQWKIDEYIRDLKFFKDLRQAVRRRYAETVDFSEYEPRIQKLIDTHVGTGEVEQVVGPIDLFDRKQRDEAIERPQSDASKADMIAHNTMRVIEQKWEEDPAFYKRFSEMLRDAIEAFRAERIRVAEFLNRTRHIMDCVVTHSGDEAPSALSNSSTAKAYYGCIKDVFDRIGGEYNRTVECAEAANEIDRIILSRRIVNWTANPDQQNRMRQDVEDFLFELKERSGIPLTFDDIDGIIENCLSIARRQSAS